MALAAGAAAPAAGQGLGFGGKAGVNWSRVRFEVEDGFDTKGRPGVVAGGFVTLPVAGRLGLEVDVFYAERRTEIEGVVEDRLTYVEIPILARYRVMSRGAWRVYAVGGAVVSLLQTAEEVAGGDRFDIEPAVESRETSAAIGAAVEIGRRLVFDVRYLHGVSDVYQASGFPAKSRTVVVTGGYRVK
jgi:hypothetical protein